MRYLVLSLILLLLVIAQPTRGIAGVAEASTTAEHQYSLRYDMAGLSAKERDWFLTFIRGNFLAEGWGQITRDILVHVEDGEREYQQRQLDQLGTKIGREWCRDNRIRRIDSSMLSEWGGKLRKAAREEPRQLAEVIRSIDAQVNSRLN